MEDQQEFTQEQFVQQQKQEEDVEERDLQIQIDNPLRQLFKQAQNTFVQEAAGTIKSQMKYRERRTYNIFANDKTEYFSSMWQHLQERLKDQSPYYETDLLEIVTNRQSNVITELLYNRLQIEKPKNKPYEAEQQQKGKKLSMLRQQSTEIQRKLLDINSDINQIKQNQHKTSESRFRPFEVNENKVKQYEEFLKKQKKEKQERAKLLQEFKKKQEEIRLKKQEEEKQAKEKIIKEKKEELLKKMKQSQERRNKSKSERQQRNKQYKFISKSMAQQPPLFKKLEEKYYSRYQQVQNERRQKVMSERHSMYQQLDTKSLQEHERKYEQMREERQKQRKERMEQFQKMIELQKQEIQSKFKSNYEPQDNAMDPKQQDRKMALQKKDRMKKYIEETVKQRYLPKIDQEKRKEFIKMIQDLSKKKVKKVKKEDGSFQYEEVRPSDPRMVGLEYLEKTKEMAAKMRGRRKNSDQIPNIQPQKPKIFDYLGQMRKKGTSMSNRDRLGFMNRKGITFDQKLKKVELQSQKLQQLAHQKQMKLKFGKFVTSQQILQHKEQIDQHYIDIINMKLKLINHKEE